MGQLLQVAGFIAIFIEANYLIREWSNAVFYRGTCHVMLQHFAVYITLGLINTTSVGSQHENSQINHRAYP